MDLKGTNYEIGRILGNTLAACTLENESLPYSSHFGVEDIRMAEKLFDRWCPGLNEELAGFADALHAAPEQIIYYAMTYLRPCCSQIALLPSRTENNHPLLARNYEFNDDAEDFSLIKTSVTGKYAHIGTSVLGFGRDDGFNECGLAVTMSSCGLPVGALKYMRKPALPGLQFWAVIRSLLENCKDTEEALHFLKGMPISYNMNLMLLDKSGTCALVETLDGKTVSKTINTNSEDSHLCATNHAVFRELSSIEPQAMVHSLRRLEYIEEMLKSNPVCSTGTLRKMLLAPYPDGLCCHHYKDYFGTTKSMIIDPVDGTIELCWGGRIENGWQTYRLSDSPGFSEREIELAQKAADPSIFQLI